MLFEFVLAAGAGRAEAADRDPQLLAFDPEFLEQQCELVAAGAQLLFARADHEQDGVGGEQRFAVDAHCFGQLAREGE